MKIKDDELKKLFALVKDTVIEFVVKLDEYIEEDKYIPQYYKYPEPFWEGFKKIGKYDEIVKCYPQIGYGVEEYNLSTYKNPSNYEDIFRISDDKFSINISKSDKFKNLCDYIKEHKEISEIMYDNAKDIDYKTCKFIAKIVNRVKYINKEDNYDSQVTNILIAEKLERYFNEKLYIDICVPLNFILFSEDKIKLTDNIYIEKIPKEMQISRFYASHYDSKDENNILQNCAYMIVIKNCSFENKNNLSLIHI